MYTVIITPFSGDTHILFAETHEEATRLCMTAASSAIHEGGQDVNEWCIGFFEGGVSDIAGDPDYPANVYHEGILLDVPVSEVIINA